ncbi:MAG TPA: GyrI-like domain-containing protein [Fluviicola sp.]|nr:GyrI-like domain-containing protein [Fluviicola sp.]
METIQSFHIIGLSVRTTNENGQSATDIGALWQRFMSDEIMAKIPSKTGNEIICVYTGYEKDHTAPYTTILGCKVENLDHIPEGMTGKTIDAGSYVRFTAHGNATEGAVYNEWVNIWDSGLDRAYTADFEVYGPESWDPVNGKVPIFIAVK